MSRRMLRRTWLASVVGGCAAAALPLLLAACAVEQSPTYAGYRPPSILTPGRRAAVHQRAGRPWRGDPGPAHRPQRRARRCAGQGRPARAGAGCPARRRWTCATPAARPQGAAGAGASGDRRRRRPDHRPADRARDRRRGRPGRRPPACRCWPSPPTRRRRGRGCGCWASRPASRCAGWSAPSTADGKNRFAAVLPQTRVRPGDGQRALTRAIADAGLASPDIHFHEAGDAAIAQTMRDVSDYADRRGPLDAQDPRRARPARRRRPHSAPPNCRARACRRRRSTRCCWPTPAAQLAWLSTFIPYYDVGPPGVRVLGPALWADPAARAGATLDGAWYAAPDPAAARQLRTRPTPRNTARRRRAWPTSPIDAASIAAHAAGLGRLLAGRAVPPAAAFPAWTGCWRCSPDGSVRRGLAVFEIHGAAPASWPRRRSSLSTPGHLTRAPILRMRSCRRGCCWAPRRRSAACRWPPCCCWR